MNTQYLRITTPARRPSKSCAVQCIRCGGSGIFGNLGSCFRCGGNGKDPTVKSWGFPQDWSDEQCRDWLVERDLRLEREKKARQLRSEAKRLEARETNLSSHPVLQKVIEYARKAAAGQDLPKRARPVELQCVTEWEDRLLRQIADKASAFVISQKQAELCEKVLSQIADRVEQRNRERKNLVEPESGRQLITGTVVSVKTYEGRYGLCQKILVACEGYNLFGSAPASVADDVERGDTVSLTAYVTPVERGFGKFSRPTKASLEKKQASVA